MDKPEKIVGHQEFKSHVLSCLSFGIHVAQKIFFFGSFCAGLYREFSMQILRVHFGIDTMMELS